jgi:hypothetical protein
VFVFVSVFVYVCKEVNNKRTPGVLVICIASSCTKKNAQEKEPKKKVHQAPEKYASSQREKRKKENKYCKASGR